MGRLFRGALGWWRGIDSPRARRVLLLILLVGGVFRVGWVAHAGVEPQFNGDPGAYLRLGINFTDGNGYTNPLVDFLNLDRAQRHEPLIAPQPASFYPPGYPVFVGSVIWVVYHTPISDDAAVPAVEYVQALLGVLTILMAFALARRVFDARVGLAAAAMVALFPNLITTTATLQLETVFVELSLAAMLVLLPAATREDPRLGRLAVAGAFMGAVVLVRPTIAILIFAFLATRIVARRPWRETAIAAAVLVGSMVAVVVPWTVRNAIALHAFVPVSTNVGATICPSRNPEATGGFDSGILARECVPKHQTGTLSQREVAANRFAIHEALHWVLAHPAGEVRMWFWRTEISYRSDASGLDEFGLAMDPRWAAVGKALSDSASFVVLGFAAIGVVVIAVRKRAAGAFLLSSAIAFALLPVILQGDPRYRVPADPLFAILAAAGVCAAIDGITRRAPTEADI
jgi:4-amino-4-deoxy-L-arabinose transferase-like glycosyltransferase